MDEKEIEVKVSRGASKFIDSIFAMKKTTMLLIGIFLLGFILRWIAVLHLTSSADMMHFVTHAINFFSSGKLETYGQSAALWTLFTSVIYKIFGTTQFAAGFASLLFGSLSILAVYLLSKEFFSEKVSLIASFLLAISPIMLKNTVAEMDLMAMFFVIMGFLFFVKALKADRKMLYAISGVFIGLAVYTKVYPLLFIPSLLIYFAYCNKKAGSPIWTKQNAKKIFIFLLMIFIFCIPALAHNYLLYQEKGFLDLQFTRTLGLGKNISEQYYGWDSQFSAKNDWKGLILGNSPNSGSPTPSLLIAFQYLFSGDRYLLAILGIFGLIFIFALKKEYKSYAYLYLLAIAFALPFLASIILLSKHYLFLAIFLTPIAALFIEIISEKLSKITKKQTLLTILAIIFILSLFTLGLMSPAGEKNFYGNNAIREMISFKENSIPKNALIVMDSRFYRGRINWVSYGRLNLEGSEFVQLFQNQDSLDGNLAQIDAYYFECALDDCGWGTVKDSPSLNSTMEQLTYSFKASGTLEKTIYERDANKPYVPLLIKNEKREAVNIYKAKIQLKEPILQQAAVPKEWFLYTIGYQPISQQFDYYSPTGFIQLSLDKLAHWIRTLALMLAFISPFYLLNLLRKKR